MNDSMNGKVAVITGAGGDLGRETARMLHERGCKLVLLDRSASLLDLTSEVCPGALPIVADVTSTQDMSAAARQAHQAYPKIDYLVAAAGIIGPVKSAIELSESEWDTLFNINVKGCWLACKEFMPSMIENRAGAVVLFSSSAAVRGSRYLPAYAASKGAVTTLTKSLAMSYADHNIRVNCVCPGTIESRMATQSFEDSPEGLAEREATMKSVIPLGRFGTVAEVAASVLFLLDDASAFTTGVALAIDGGRTA